MPHYKLEVLSLITIERESLVSFSFRLAGQNVHFPLSFSSVVAQKKKLAEPKKKNDLA